MLNLIREGLRYYLAPCAKQLRSLPFNKPRLAWLLSGTTSIRQDVKRLSKAKLWFAMEDRSEVARRVKFLVSHYRLSSEDYIVIRREATETLSCDQILSGIKAVSAANFEIVRAGLRLFSQLAFYIPLIILTSSHCKAIRGTAWLADNCIYIYCKIFFSNKKIIYSNCLVPDIQKIYGGLNAVEIAHGIIQTTHPGFFNFEFRGKLIVFDFFSRQNLLARSSIQIDDLSESYLKFSKKITSTTEAKTYQRVLFSTPTLGFQQEQIDRIAAINFFIKPHPNDQGSFVEINFDEIKYAIVVDISSVLFDFYTKSNRRKLKTIWCVKHPLDGRSWQQFVREISIFSNEGLPVVPVLDLNNLIIDLSK